MTARHLLYLAVIVAAALVALLLIDSADDVDPVTVASTSQTTVEPLDPQSTTGSSVTMPTTTTTARPRGPKHSSKARSGPIVNAASVDGRCGGDLPPCFVYRRESAMAEDPLRVWNGHCYYEVGYTGDNPCGSTASGKWQFLRSTWARFMGYLNAADAPEWVQDEKARLTWDGGRGCSHWAAC